MFDHNQKKVLDAIAEVDRADFLPEDQKRFSDVDTPLPLKRGQTMSAIHMYAIMLNHALLEGGLDVLEVGTGSGYGAALIKRLVGLNGRVISLERIGELADFAEENLKKKGLEVEVVHADGTQGYDKFAPYDRIIVTAAADNIPAPLIKQLKIGGIMLIPVGKDPAILKKVTKSRDGTDTKDLGVVRFVSLLSELA